MTPSRLKLSVNVQFLRKPSVQFFLGTQKCEERIQEKHCSELKKHYDIVKTIIVWKSQFFSIRLYTKRQPSVTMPAWPSTLIKNLLLAMQRDACLLFWCWRIFSISFIYFFEK